MKLKVFTFSKLPHAISVQRAMSVYAEDEPPVFTRAERVLRSTSSSAEPPAIAKLCRDRNYLRRVADDAGSAPVPASHNMYGNMHFMGVMHVPAGEPTRELAAAYITDFYAGRYSAITENKPAGAVRFYIDYDWETPTWPSEAQWRTVEAIEKAALLKFYPAGKLDDAMFASIVTSSGVANVNADGRSAFKVGLHVYYPNLYVTIEQALFLSTAILVTLKQRFPEEAGWDKKLDQAVYDEGRGLRWVYQFKHGACACGAASKPKRRGPAPKTDVPRCALCAGCGYVPDVSSSMHAPLYRVNGYGTRTFFDAAVRHTPTVELMLEFSLRAYERATPTDGFVRYATAAPIPVLLLQKAKRGAAAARGPGVSVTCTGDALFNKWTKDSDSEELALSSMEARVIQAALRAKDSHRSALRVKALFKRKSARSSYFKVQVQGEGSGYCLNYRQSHRSATVYFIVRPRGFIQKCTCRCVDLRTSGKPCSVFESTEFGLSENETAALFGTSGPSSFMVPVSGAVARAFAATPELDASRALPVELISVPRFIANAGAGGAQATNSALTADASAGLAFGLGLTNVAPSIFGNPMDRGKMLTLKRPRAATRT